VLRFEISVGNAFRKAAFPEGVLSQTLTLKGLSAVGVSTLTMSAADTLSERLATMVVIHPGATTLRIGIADAQPVAIPHCVAYLGAHQATVTTPFTSMLAGGDSRERRRAAYNRLEQRLGVQQRPIIQVSRHCSHCSNDIPDTGWGLQAAGPATSG
jgi:hypothetical protein